MTGRTHDLFALISLTMILIHGTVPAMTLVTAITAFGANFLGRYFPTWIIRPRKFGTKFAMDGS